MPVDSTSSGGMQNSPDLSNRLEAREVNPVPISIGECVLLSPQVALIASPCMHPFQQAISPHLKRKQEMRGGHQRFFHLCVKELEKHSGLT